MPPLGYALILIGVLLARQVMVGRASNTVEDLRDAALGFLSGDTGAVKDAFSRRGGGGSGVVSSSSFPEIQTGGGGSSYGLAVMNAAVTLGKNAKGYVWGATGPNYYDCSGLIWRACQKAKVYTGGRFTSASFPEVMALAIEEVQAPAAGDIIVWRGKHMGIATGPDSYYSARSPSKGIGGASITGDAGYFGTTPEVFRITKAI